MTLDEAGRRQAAWKAKHGDKICKHMRMVDYLISKNGRNTGYVVCIKILIVRADKFAADTCIEIIACYG